MKNSDLHHIKQKIRIAYANESYVTGGTEKKANIFDEYVYKEIGRHVNILVRYIEDFDAIFSVEKYPEGLKEAIINNLNKILNETNEDVPIDLRIIDGVLRMKIVEFKGWNKSMIDTIENITKHK